MTHIVYGEDLRTRLLRGAGTLSSIIVPNYGPDGRNAVVNRIYDLPMVVNTGRKLLDGFELEDRDENIGAVLMREAALKVGKQYGDGTIATALLCSALITSGCRLIAAGHNPVLLRDGLLRVLPAAVDAIRGISQPCEHEQLQRFAAVVSKNKEIGENVFRAFNMVGINGVVTVQESQGRDSVLNYWDGVRYDSGMAAAVFAEDRENVSTVYENPAVMLINRKIKSVSEIQKVLEDTVRCHVPLLIIAADLDENVQRMLAANVARKMLRVTVAKAPGHGDTRRRNMLALAAKTGALMIDENSGHDLENCGLSVCAQVDKAVIDKNYTMLQGFHGESEEMVSILKKHTENLAVQTNDPDETEKLQTTMAILNGRIAEITVGGVTEYEMFEKKYLYENTVCAVRTAGSSGLVPGGGSAFLYASRAVDKAAECLPEALRAGAECLAEALRSPVRILAENAGDDGNYVLCQLEHNRDPMIGYNAQTHAIERITDQGIQDPTEAVIAALTVAADTAASVWTAEAAVIGRES